MAEFKPGLRAELESRLAGLDRVAIPLDGRLHAAVAVVVVAAGDGASAKPAPAAFLLTRRSSRLRAHPGQWALPGGRVDDLEDPLDAVLRELDEELAVALPPSSLLGVLDDYATRSGYVITPYVLWGGDDVVIRPHPDEVRVAYRIPFAELCRDDSPRFVAIPESDRPVVQIPIGDALIHAPTGAILLQFRRVALEGVTERVSGYEQPVFAWR
jgi:8-oxo-dGTP pyrophosphatase MutT (NUDIX family)